MVRKRAVHEHNLLAIRVGHVGIEANPVACNNQIPLGGGVVHIKMLFVLKTWRKGDTQQPFCAARASNLRWKVKQRRTQYRAILDDPYATCSLDHKQPVGPIIRCRSVRRVFEPGEWVDASSGRPAVACAGRAEKTEQYKYGSEFVVKSH